MPSVYADHMLCSVGSGSLLAAIASDHQVRQLPAPSIRFSTFRHDCYLVNRRYGRQNIASKLSNTQPPTQNQMQPNLLPFQTVTPYTMNHHHHHSLQFLFDGISHDYICFCRVLAHHQIICIERLHESFG